MERFFHIRPNLHNGGATVRVTGGVGGVDIQVSYCHARPKDKKKEDRSDVFCRKTGREIAAAAPIRTVPLRYLPKELERIEAAATKKAGMRVHKGILAGSYDFAIKYFLPKE
jgi:hypothetical protein